LIVISGPSGVGKDTVLQRMKDRMLPFYFVVTATTRKPRSNEVEGVDYFFVSHAVFARMIEQGELVEYAYVYNDYKGIPKSQIDNALASGKDVIMRLDVQGAASVRKMYKGALLIFLTTESEEDLVRRLEKRRSEKSDERDLRIAMARRELTRLDEFDYVLVNEEDQVDKTVDEIMCIVRTERHRTNPRKMSE
jgi:guanylate kinase